MPDSGMKCSVIKEINKIARFVPPQIPLSRSMEYVEDC